MFGTDYPGTSDGTAVRDYLHVMDAASGHAVVLEELLRVDYDSGAKIYNIGIGKGEFCTSLPIMYSTGTIDKKCNLGTSVLEIIDAFEKASGIKIPTKLTGRRVGDIEASYACCKKIEEELGWKAKYDINDMCKSEIFNKITMQY